MAYNNITQSMENLSSDSAEFKRALKILIKYEIHCLLQRLSDTGEEAIVITTSFDEDIPGHLATAKGEGFLQDTHAVPALKEQFHRYCSGSSSPVDYIEEEDNVVIKRECGGDRDKVPECHQLSIHTDASTVLAGHASPSLHSTVTPTQSGRRPQSIHSRAADDSPSKRQRQIGPEGRFSRNVRGTSGSSVCHHGNKAQDSEIRARLFNPEPKSFQVSKNASQRSTNGNILSSLPEHFHAHYVDAADEKVDDDDDDDDDDRNLHTDNADQEDGNIGESDADSATLDRSTCRDDDSGPGHMTVVHGNEHKQSESDNIPMDFSWKMEKIKPLLDNPESNDDSRPLDGNQNTLHKDCDTSVDNYVKLNRLHSKLKPGSPSHKESIMGCDMSKESLDAVCDYFSGDFQGKDYSKHHTFLPQMPPAFSDDLVDYSLRTRKFWQNYFSESPTSMCKDGRIESMSHSNEDTEACLTQRIKDFENSAGDFSGSVLHLQKDFYRKKMYDSTHPLSSQAESLMLSHDTNSDATSSVDSEPVYENKDAMACSRKKEQQSSRSQQAYSKYGFPDFIKFDSPVKQNEGQSCSRIKEAASPCDNEPVNLKNDQYLLGEESGQKEAKRYMFDSKIDEVINLKSEIKLEPLQNEGITSIEQMLENANVGKFVGNPSLAHGPSPIHLNFSCKICGQVFKNRQYRDFHVKLHESSHRYLCSLCSEGFNTEAACAKHQSEHTEPVFQCENCGYRCTREFRMRAHKEICGSPSKIHVCPYCDKQFAAQRYMRIHMKSHDTKNVHTCPYCQNTYPLKNSLLKHMKKKHTSSHY